MDVALTGFQKALSFPIGVGITCARPKALELAKTVKSLMIFFDENDYLNFFKLGTYWPYTPLIQLLYGLWEAPCLILFVEGLYNIIVRTTHLQKETK